MIKVSLVLFLDEMKSNNVCREDKDEINQHDIVTWLFSRKQSTVVILTRCSLER